MSLTRKGVALFGKRLPKVIGPRTHAVIDYAVAGAFFSIGILFWSRNKRAAIGALICGTVTALNSVVTDYPGGIWKEMSYQNHGRVDAGLAGLTAAMPNMLDFSDDAEARFFEFQATAETVVTVLTDFEAQVPAGVVRQRIPRAA